VDLGFEDETFGVYQQVTLTPLDLLASVITPIFAAYCGTLDRLAIHHAGAGLRISVQANTKAFTDRPIDLFPGAVDAPSSEVMVDGGPSREVMGKQTPLTATF
jgi:hypothetical protein